MDSLRESCDSNEKGYLLLYGFYFYSLEAFLHCNWLCILYIQFQFERGGGVSFLFFFFYKKRREKEIHVILLLSVEK